MFIKKLTVAFILLPPFLWIWWRGGFFFLTLFTLFSVIAADEIIMMATNKNAPYWLRIVITGLTLLVSVSIERANWAAVLGLSNEWFKYAPNTIYLFVLFVLMCMHVFSFGLISQAGPRLFASFFAVFYAVLPISSLVELRMDSRYGLGFTFLCLSMTWLCDSFAYIGGKQFGKTKIAPLLSPNKSLEGLVFGMCASALASLLSAFIFGLPYHWSYLFLLGLLAGLFGQIGDLAESLIKRSFGVKDSGSLIPGHGGVLDRFDAVLFVAPLVVLFVNYCPR